MGRRSLFVPVLLAIASGVALIAQAVPPTLRVPPGPAVAMTRVDPGSPISATVRITSTGAGSRVEMECSYSPTAKPYTFRLVAYGPDEQTEQLGSWLAQPGSSSCCRPPHTSPRAACRGWSSSAPTTG